MEMHNKEYNLVFLCGKEIILTSSKYKPVRNKHGLDMKLGNMCLILKYLFFFNDTSLKLELKSLYT